MIQELSKKYPGKGCSTDSGRHPSKGRLDPEYNSSLQTVMTANDKL
jgi:hypothetical protein